MQGGEKSEGTEREVMNERKDGGEEHVRNTQMGRKTERH